MESYVTWACRKLRKMTNWSYAERRSYIYNNPVIEEVSIERYMIDKGVETLPLSEIERISSIHQPLEPVIIQKLHSR